MGDGKEGWCGGGGPLGGLGGDGTNEVLITASLVIDLHWQWQEFGMKATHDTSTPINGAVPLGASPAGWPNPCCLGIPRFYVISGDISWRCEATLVLDKNPDGLELVRGPQNQNRHPRHCPSLPNVGSVVFSLSLDCRLQPYRRAVYGTVLVIK